MKKSNLFRIISIVLVLVMLAVSLASCATDEPPAESLPGEATPSVSESDSTPESPESSDAPAESTEPLETPPAIPEVSEDMKIIADGKTSFKVVRAELAAAYEKSFTSSLSASLKDASGVTVPVSDDWVNEALGYKENEYEILIGRTNRDESELVYGSLRTDDYAVTIVGTKLVIAAFTEAKMTEAIAYFNENVQTDSGSAVFPASASKISRGIYGIDSITVNGTELSNYKIVYKTGGTALIKNAANLLAEKLLSAYGYNLKVVTDSAAESPFEIIIGGTNRGTSQDVANELNSFDYSITVSGTRVFIIPGANDTMPDIVVEKLLDTLKELNAGKKIEMNPSTLNVRYASNYATKNITLNVNAISSYTIIYKNNDPVTSKLAYYLRDEIDRVCGRRLTVASDSQSYRGTKEILVGLCNRVSDSGQATGIINTLHETGGGEYLAYLDGDFFFLGGNDYVATVGAVSKFIDAVRNVTDAENHVVDFSVNKGQAVNQTKYSVMTYNDGDNATTRLNQIAAVISDYAPDIVGLQEVQKMHVPMYEAKLPQYDAVYYDHDNYNYGAPILYNKVRFELVEEGTQWLSSTPDKFGSSFADSDYIRSYVYVILRDKETGEEIVAVNTHIDYIASANTKQIDVLIDCTERFRGRPIIYTGDFNMQNTSEGYSKMFAAGLRDCGTYLGYNIKGHIDFCFVDPIFVVPTAYKYITDHQYSETASDHYPVYSEIVIPG